MSTLVYYPTGVVHMRNLELLGRALADVRFRVLYLPGKDWVSPEAVHDYPYEAYFETNGLLPGGLFGGKVDGILLSIAAMDSMVARLIRLVTITRPISPSGRSRFSSSTIRTTAKSSWM